MTSTQKEELKKCAEREAYRTFIEAVADPDVLLPNLYDDARRILAENDR